MMIEALKNGRHRLQSEPLGKAQPVFYKALSEASDDKGNILVGRFKFSFFAEVAHESDGSWRRNK